MKALSTIKNRQESGFTLVELAIVLIIIGLLIGGILKGQELIANAQITNAVSQIKGVDGAVATFRETYGSFPGDFGNAVNRIAGCTTANACGNPTGTINNGRVDVAIGAIPVATVTNEGYLFFNHMRVADLITGLTGGSTVAFGISHPEASIGGGFTIGHTSVTGSVITASRAGHYLVLTGSTTALANASGTGALSASQAARIDRKLDDAAATSGSVLGINDGGGTGSATGCFAAAANNAAGAYNENLVNPLCNLAIRIQG